MGKIKGQNLRIFYNGAVVAKATNCSIQINGNTEDASTKDDAALATAESIVSKSWQVQVDSFDETNISALLTAWKNHTAITVKWDITSGTGNATAAGADLARTGSAFISDASFQFNDRAIVASNFTLMGTGAISTIS